MVYIICMAMFGNGVQTCMARILQLHKPTPQALHQVRAALFVAAAGATMPRVAGRPIGRATARSAPTAVSGFAWCLPPSFEELKGERKKSEREKLKGESLKGKVNQFLLRLYRSLEMIYPE